ncbi:hypothetical protein L9F63_027912, partial [Diploptera punctata]
CFFFLFFFVVVCVYVSVEKLSPSRVHQPATQPESRWVPVRGKAEPLSGSSAATQPESRWVPVQAIFPVLSVGEKGPG